MELNELVCILMSVCICMRLPAYLAIDMINGLVSVQLLRENVQTLLHASSMSILLS